MYCRAAKLTREMKLLLKHPYKLAILTASDKAFAGQRGDESGPAIRQLMAGQGYTISCETVLPDDEELIAAQLLEWSNEPNSVDIILTTGGTGLSPRDCMPEATTSVATRMVPGIAEAMRSYSMTITKRAMLSRAVSVICNQTLIINLPGSPKAVKEILAYILPELEHALDTLTSRSSECATQPS